jgi:hypothetical protein
MASKIELLRAQEIDNAQKSSRESEVLGLSADEASTNL